MDLVLTGHARGGEGGAVEGGEVLFFEEGDELIVGVVDDCSGFDKGGIWRGIRF